MKDNGRVGRVGGLLAGSVFFLLLGVLAGGPAWAEDAETPPGRDPVVMDNNRLEVLIKRLDPQATGQPGFWQLKVDDYRISVITDQKADRMRIVVPVARANDLERDRLYRLLQANFDSALDARYAVAKGAVWSTFIHPLAALDDKEFIFGLGQVVNLAITYGGSFSSGALIFKGGDSRELEKRRQLIDRLLEKGLRI
jgi:hypothetical protein